MLKQNLMATKLYPSNRLRHEVRTLCVETSDMSSHALLDLRYEIEVLLARLVRESHSAIGVYKRTIIRGKFSNVRIRITVLGDGYS